MKVVMYHYVRSKEERFPCFRFLLRENFLRQLDYFSREFGYVTKENFLRSLETGVPSPGVVLTFDDGLKDHVRYVLPELQKRGLWGIFYVPTLPLVERTFLDVHKIHLLLTRSVSADVLRAVRSLVTDDMLTHRDVSDFNALTYKPFNDDDATNSVKRILNYHIGAAYRARVFSELMKKFAPDADDLFSDFYLSRDDLRELRASGMIVGSHSHAHTVMRNLPFDEQRADVARSFAVLGEITGPLEMKTFAQPYGGFFSFNADTERALEEEGCLFSFNVEPRDIEARDLQTRRQALPRFDCNAFPFYA